MVNPSDNNNCSHGIRNITQRLLLIIASIRRRLEHDNLANDTGLALQFCEGGEFCCVFSEQELGDQYLDNSRMSTFLNDRINNRHSVRLEYADDVEISIPDN